VIGIDYVPTLLDRARERAISEGVPAQFEDGDAEAIPFEDASFDVVTSVFGAMFAPEPGADRERARPGREARRPDRPRRAPRQRAISGQLFKLVGTHVPPPAGLRSPVQWGTEARLRELFGDRIAELTVEKRHLVFRYTARPRRGSTTGAATTAPP
jgi:hypothetical protein